MSSIPDPTTTDQPPVRMQPWFTMSRRLLLGAVVGTVIAFNREVGVGGGIAVAGMWIAFAWIYIKEDLVRAGITAG